ncbi:MAG TPA: hypothetical protein VN841_22360 [Bryobacteraceae bacterium]|nr:hypothetical protein [Bryobacteraceae bacterium]
MPDALSTITEFIIEPAAPFAAGGVLFGIVWELFKRVESILNKNTKMEIAVWLMGLTAAEKVPWPNTFGVIFERIFGERHLSWKCFRTSAIISVGLSCGVQGIWYLSHPRDFPALATDVMQGLGVAESTFSRWLVVPALLAFNALSVNGVADYLSLWKTRSLLKRFDSFSRARQISLLLLDTLLSGLIGAAVLIVMLMVLQPILYKQSAFADFDEFKRFLQEMIFGGYVYGDSGPPESTFFYPAFFPSVWLWLYAGSGFLLKAAREFDIGFKWFNRRFNIEGKPLSSIGLVAAALVAILWWIVVIVSLLVH